MKNAELPFRARPGSLQNSLAQWPILRDGSPENRDQVAAVCFRISNRDIEFLLVRTGGGCWTFPKGRYEPGLTRAQSAAIEAFEEAGVHGRIEEAPFAQYLYRKRRRSRSDREKLVVHAHLCEVANAERPQEARRDPKWFSAEKAKRKLCEGRADKDSEELARVIDLAVLRVRRTEAVAAGVAEDLRKVKFDAFAIAGTPAHMQSAAMRRYLQREPAVNADRWTGSRETRSRRLLTGKVLPMKARKISAAFFR